MKKILRPYQKEVFQSLTTHFTDEKKDYNILVNASVGSGKSLIIAEFLLYLQKNNKKALCLTSNSTLIQQNCSTYIAQDGEASIYCAALSLKEYHQPIIFASPMSVNNAIKSKIEIANNKFDVIVIDEAHNVNFGSSKTNYMNIYNHFKSLNNNLIVIGLTGTPYRGKGNPIVGEHLFFKEQVGNIDAHWLIENGYLTKPEWGYTKDYLHYKFNQIKVGAQGKFSQSDLEKVIHEDLTLTDRIMIEVTKIMKKRNGAFIFASSIKHVEECMRSLPEKQAAFILGTTPDKEREDIIQKARMGKIKYLVNMNVLCVGVDIPNYDTVVMVRPTESLVLYTQCLGRGLRLSEGKKECLILDYAQNLDRHGDLEHPILRYAMQSITTKDHSYCISCPQCHSMNKLTARKCVGYNGNTKCSYLFRYKECPFCKEVNDISARECRKCKNILIDPNLSLSELAAFKSEIIKLDIETTRYLVYRHNGKKYFKIKYYLMPGYFKDKFKDNIQENYRFDKETDRALLHEAFKRIHPDTYESKVILNLDQDALSDHLNKVTKSHGLLKPTSIEGLVTYDGFVVTDRFYDKQQVFKPKREVEVLDKEYYQTGLNGRYIMEYLVKDKDELYYIQERYNLTSALPRHKFNRNFLNSPKIESDADIKNIKWYELCTPASLSLDEKNKITAHSTQKKDRQELWDRIIHYPEIKEFEDTVFDIRCFKNIHGSAYEFIGEPPNAEQFRFIKLSAKLSDELKHLLHTNQLKGFTVTWYRKIISIHQFIDVNNNELYYIRDVF